MKIFAKYFTMMATFIAIVSIVGCEEMAEEIPQVKAGFTHTINEDTGTVTFINTSENATKYLWDFGDKQFSKEIDPIKTYLSGTYIVTLTASNVAGGSDILQDTLTIAIKGLVTIPATFDDPKINYNAIPINGASYKVVDNPDKSGTNNKATKVGSITNKGATFEGIYFDLGAQLDLTTNKRVTMNFWAKAPVPVLLKLEQGTSANVEKSVNHGGTGWESISFDFASSSKYSRLTLFVDGPGTTAGTFYFDDIKQEVSPVTCIAETAQSLSAANFNLTFQTDPGTSIISDNAGFEWASNPNFENVINNTCKVGKITRTAASAFANNQINLDAKLNFTTNSGFKVKVFSDAPGIKLTIKLEDKVVAATNTELTVTTTKTNEWEELTYPFASSQTNKYDKIILFFDLNTNNAKIYYFDDLKLYGTGSGPVCVAETAQSITAANFNLTFQTDPGTAIGSFDANYTYASNPNVNNAVNTSCNVGKIDRNASALFANNQIEFTSKLDFTTHSGFKLKVFSSTVAYNVLVKLEDKTDQNINTEVSRTTTVGANQWEELTFPFASNQSGKYDKIILFFQLNTTTTATYFIDDFAYYGTGGGGTTSGCVGTPIAAPSLPLDFEGCATFLASENFGSGITSELAANPSKTGINTSNYVLKVNKPTGSDFYAGIQNTFASNFNLTTTNTFKLKVYSTKPNVVFRFELAVNPQTNPVTGNPAPVFKTIANANEWTEVSFTFTGLPGAPTAYNQLVIKPDNTATDSPITAGGVYYLDDLTLSAGGGSGATSPTTAAPTPPARAAGDVISLFSEAYTNVTVDTWRTGWSAADFQDVTIAGNATKKYSNLDFVGVETVANKVNATDMTHVHVDVWSADFTQFSLKLVNFGTSTTEHQVDYSTPAKGEWISYDIPLTSFTGLAARGDLAQYIFVGRPIGANTIFLDNIYFYRTGAPPTAPTTAAPTPPARAAGDVISLFSEAYTNVTVDTWRTGWSAADFQDVTIAGNATKKYSALDFVGIETFNPKVNATAMTHVHVDVWSPDFTQFSLKLVNFGSSTTEHQVDYFTPAKGQWISYDIPLTSFTGLAARGDLAQYIFVGRPIAANTIFIDNLYFYKTAGGGAGTNLAANGDFETGTDSGWVRFQNGGTSVLDNTINNGGTWSGKLATNGPSNPAFKQERIGAGTVKAGDVVRVKFDHKGAIVPPGGVFNVLLFGEKGTPGASFTHVFNPAPNPGASFTTFTGTFTIPGGTDVSEGISVLIEAVCGGDAGCSVSVNIDNVSVVLNP